MKIAIFWAWAEGAHPSGRLDVYKQIWPVMHRRVKEVGYKLTWLTVPSEKNDMPCDERLNFDVTDVRRSALAREEAWMQYLERHVSDTDQVAQIEPDTYLRREIPPLGPDHDMILIRRDKPPTPTCFKLVKKSAMPFYAEILKRIPTLHSSLHTWCGDAAAQEQLVPDCRRPPSEVFGVRIEVREFRDYCLTQGGNGNAVCWTYNGHFSKKRRMLSLP